MTLRRIAFAAVIVLALSATVAATTSTGVAQTGGLTVDRSDTYEITRLTGPTSINRTDAKWYVYGTDLGHIVAHKGGFFMLFGDTFGPPGHPPTFGTDWRSNTLAVIRDNDPWDGVSFNEMITDRPGHAKELINRSDLPGEGVTVIPTNVISVEKRIFLHYMDVRQWATPVPGDWVLNRSGLAYSDDDGQNWTVSDTWWPGDSNFGQVAFIERGKHVYLFGIPGGRFGAVHLARVEKQAMLELDRYEFWDGTGWVGDREAAATVVPAPVGELSVQWNSHYRKWLMTYLNDDDDAVNANAIVLRTADCLTGPWSDEQVIVTAKEVPTLYAPYMPQRWNSGPDIFFTLTRFNLYDVFWWHTSLDGESGSAQEARCVSP
jgi:hypothetical protein